MAHIRGDRDVSVAILGFRATKQSRTVLSRPATLLHDYNNWRNRILVNLVLNLALGMGVGVVGSIYDIFLRRFVAAHAKALLRGLKSEEAQ